MTSVIMTLVLILTFTDGRVEEINYPHGFRKCAQEAVVIQATNPEVASAVCVQTFKAAEEVTL